MGGVIHQVVTAATVCVPVAATASTVAAPRRAAAAVRRGLDMGPLAPILNSAVRFFSLRHRRTARTGRRWRASCQLYIDPATSWLRYRYREDAVQPEGGKSEYIDPAAAAKQRERWRADELAEAEYEQTREHYADEMFPEPYPKYPDDDSSVSEPWSDSNVDPQARSPQPTPMATPSHDADEPDAPAVPSPPTSAAPARDTAQHIDGHRGTWPLVLLMANVVMLTVAVTAGTVLTLSPQHGGHRSTYALAPSTLSLAAVYAIALAVALSIAFTMFPLANISKRWARSLSQGR
eukprot:2336911-Pleurochrysis_carterae.AAC.3